jgi:hypothetical protein
MHSKSQIMFGTEVMVRSRLRMPTHHSGPSEMYTAVIAEFDSVVLLPRARKGECEEKRETPVEKPNSGVGWSAVITGASIATKLAALAAICPMTTARYEPVPILRKTFAFLVRLEVSS